MRIYTKSISLQKSQSPKETPPQAQGLETAGNTMSALPEHVCDNFLTKKYVEMSTEAAKVRERWQIPGCQGLLCCDYVIYQGKDGHLPIVLVLSQIS